MTHTAPDSLHALRTLAATPGSASAPRIWRALTTAERTAAAGALLASAPGVRGAFVGRVAAARHFRASTVQSWPDDKLCAAFALTRLSDPRLVHDLLVSLHVPGRAHVIGAFLNALGVPHEGGFAEPDVLRSQEPDDAAVAEAFSAALAAAGDDEGQVLAYLLTLSLEKAPIGTRLTAWLGERYREGAAAGAAEDADVAGAPAADTAPEDVETFTTLDGQLIRAIVDCAQGIEGALDADQIEDLIAEVLQLNSSRQRSYFHAGFRDVLFGRELHGPGREESVSRARWYWAGVIQGLARGQRWDRITELMSEHATVQTLGDGADGASHAAASHMIRALFAAGRPSEVPRFVDRRALQAWPKLFPLLVEEGTKVLREDRASEVKGTFDLLAEAMDSLPDAEDLLEIPGFREARRRHAHCLRQLGEFVRARAVIENLLASDPTPDEKAMLLADLGLLDARLRRLADVKLPSSPSDQEIFLEALSRGQPRFEEASRLEVPYSAHARLCLGVLHLGDGRLEEAMDELEQARAAFLARPDRYAGGDLIESTELCLGIAQALALRTERMSGAAAMIARALDAGLAFPEAFLRETLEAFTLAPEEAKRTVARALLSRPGPAALDAIAASDLRRFVPEVAAALLARADEPTRTSAEKAADLRVALEVLIQNQRIDDAADVLDRLEELAVADVGAEELADLLEDPARYEPVWTRDDAVHARAHVLESLGRYADAGTLLVAMAHRVLSTDREGALDDAAQILERVERLGVGEDVTESLRARIAAGREQEALGEPPAAEAEPRTVRVLVVGGGEAESKLDEAIRRALRRRAPHVEVVFQRTGWSGNWGPHLDAFRREVVSCDAVVIVRLIRTELSRQIRKACQVPWRLCWGGGRDQAVRAILAAAEAA